MRWLVLPLLVQGASAPALTAQTAQSYFPPRGQWQTRSPAAVGLDSAKLQQAVDFALANGATWDFEKDQVRTFGTPLGPLPKQRAGTNGIILRHGYIVAQFGDTKANDPVYSVAKSFLSTVAAVAVERGLIKNVNDPVAAYIHDGGYDSPHNSAITWKNHLQQTSEWEGTLWGKNADFVGAEQFGAGQRQPRAIQAPGTFYEYNDVRINRLLAVAAAPLSASGCPTCSRRASWIRSAPRQTGAGCPTTIRRSRSAGHMIGSVSGGTRWGGGLWINSEDLARFGLLILNHGKWENRQLVSAQWLKDAVTPSGVSGTDYGYLWWLNTKKKQWPSAPASSFAAIGNGSNTIWIDPDHDIVFVWHWHQGQAMDPMIQRIMAAVIAP